MSGPTAIFRLSSGQDLLLTVAIQQDACSTLAADIAFRFLQRLSLATAERLERLLTTQSGTGEAAEVETVPPERPGEPDLLRPKSQAAPILALSTSSTPSLSRSTLNWLRMTLGWEAPSVAHTPHSEKSDRLASDGSGMIHGWNPAFCHGATPPPRSPGPYLHVHADSRSHAVEVAFGLPPRPEAADLARPGDRRPPERPGRGLDRPPALDLPRPARRS